MSEEQIVKYFSLTLAGLKPGGMYSFSIEGKESLNDEVKKFNAVLNAKGVYLCILKRSKRKALVYLYRKALLERTLKSDEWNYLYSLGYSGKDITDLIREIRLRMNESEKFPHEIGLFLGYPLFDIKQFISNKGKNYQLVGDWVVYHDSINAKKIFDKYQKCRRIYYEKYKQGTSILKLTTKDNWQKVSFN